MNIPIVNPHPLMVLTNPKKKKGSTMRKRKAVKKHTAKKTSHPTVRRVAHAPKRRHRNPSNSSSGGNSMSDLFILILASVGGAIASKMLANLIIKYVPSMEKFKGVIEGAIAVAINTFGSKVMSQKVAQAMALGAGASGVISLLKQYLPESIAGQLNDVVGESIFDSNTMQGLKDGLGNSELLALDNLINGLNAKNNNNFEFTPKENELLEY